MSQIFSSLFVLVLVLLSCGRAETSSSPERVDIVQYGAVGDGKTLNTLAIQSAIDKCADAGGGTLLIPAGTFLSGALFLKPGVNLHLDKGAVLQGSTDIADYPEGETRIEGKIQTWVPALVNAAHATISVSTERGRSRAGEKLSGTPSGNGARQ